MKKFFCRALLICFLSMQNFCFALSNLELLDVQINPISLNSRLKKDFTGYEYVITNNQKQKINIVNAQIQNGQDGNMAFNKSEVDNGVGITWAIAGPVGLFTLGIGWAVGLIATPIVVIVQNKKNKKMRNECISYTNILQTGVLNQMESVSVKTLVPIGSKPLLKLTIMDSKNNIHTINK